MSLISGAAASHRRVFRKQCVGDQRSTLGLGNRLHRRVCASAKVSDLVLSEAGPGSSVVFYLPGTDGSGQAIVPQVAGLQAASLSVHSLYIPPANRSSWGELVAETVPFVRKAAQDSGRPVILLGDSFGACLALRVALASPDLLQSLVLVNSATSFNRSLGGVAAAVSSTNLLQLFPEPMYNVAQAVLMPFLLDRRRTSSEVSDRLKAMIQMTNTNQALPRRGGPGLPLPFLHEPAGAANFRLNLMKEGNLSDADYRKISTPTLLICSAQDRLLPSLQEGARLQQLMPNARRLILPNSGHTPLLESAIDLVELFHKGRILESPEPCIPISAAASQPASRPVATATATASTGYENGNGSGERTALPTATSGQSAMLSSSLKTASNGPSSSATQPAAFELGGTRPAVLDEQTPSSWTSRNGSAGGSTSSNGAPASSAAGNGGRNGSQPRGGRERFNLGVLDANFEKGAEMFAFWRDLISPVVLGVENIPTQLEGRSMLFVGNHTQFGMYDMPLIWLEMYFRGIVLKGVAHEAHWNTPMGAFFEKFGAIKASPMATYRALKNGDNVLLFPGGGREVVKRRGEEHTLIWTQDNASSFVRMAAKCDAVIVPFASVGADDAFELFMDTDEILQNPVMGPLATRVAKRIAPNLPPGDGTIFPITTIPGTNIPSPFPVSNFQRVYFKFGEPLDTRELVGPRADKQVCEEVYTRVRGSIEREIDDLLRVRAADPHNDVLPRLRSYFDLETLFSRE